MRIKSRTVFLHLFPAKVVFIKVCELHLTGLCSVQRPLINDTPLIRRRLFRILWGANHNNENTYFRVRKWLTVCTSKFHRNILCLSDGVGLVTSSSKKCCTDTVTVTVVRSCVVFVTEHLTRRVLCPHSWHAVCCTATVLLYKSR